MRPAVRDSRLAVRGSRFAVRPPSRFALLRRQRIGRPQRRALRRLVLAFTIAIPPFIAAACGSPDSPSPSSQAPTVACPANLNVSGVVGGAQPVSYPSPSVTGGTQPVSVACAPASGTTFSTGTTTVSCTATDASSRTAQCSFTVSLSPALRLAVTKFMAFGDSFTEGEDGRSLRLVPRSPFIDPQGTYPYFLGVMLNTDYAAEAIEVLNRGQSGESINDGRARLELQELPRYHPQALLLLDGYNDLLNSCGAARPQDASSPQCSNAINEVVTSYRKMIQTAKSSGVAYVFASTLTPSGPYIPGPQIKKDRRIAVSAITTTNSKLVPVISAEGATLVDSYAAFAGHEAEYISDDGLHPRPAGYQALAGAFFAAIKAAVPSTSALH